MKTREADQHRRWREVDRLLDSGLSVNEAIVEVAGRYDLSIKSAAPIVLGRARVAARRHAMTAGVAT